MKRMIAVLGLLMVSLAAVSLQAAPSQPDIGRTAHRGEFSQWAQKQHHPSCICVINGYTFCMDATKCTKCAGECSW